MTTTDTSSTSQTSSPPADSGASPAAAVAAVEPAAVVPAKVETPAAVAAPVEIPVVEASKEPAAAAPVVAAPVIPDLYELKGAKGETVDPTVAKALSPALKAAGLTAEKANSLVSAFLESQAEAPKRMLARDLEVTMKDPEIGGMNWGKTQGMINEALSAFTTPEFRSKLERWGIANDLEFVRVFASIGKAMRGDVPTRGSPSSISDESMADRMYRRAVKPGVQ